MQVLYAQERAARGEAIGRMKAAGMGYEERMAEADSITWPRPLAELLEGALAVYRQTNPWVDGYDLTPKSIVREMVERAETFSEFVSRYDLARSEGVLLRYLSDVYKALRQTVPLEARTDEVDEITQWLGTLVRSVDSSLLDEWEALADGRVTPEEAARMSGEAEGGLDEVAFGADENGAAAFTRNRHAFKAAVRNAAFRRVEAVQFEDLDALDRLDGEPAWAESSRFGDADSQIGDEGGEAEAAGGEAGAAGSQATPALGEAGPADQAAPANHGPGPVWDGDAWMDATDPYFDVYEGVGIDSRARGNEFFRVQEQVDAADLAEAGVPREVAEALVEGKRPGRLWIVTQVFDDGEGDGGWGFRAFVDLDECDEMGAAKLRVIHVGEL